MILTVGIVVAGIKGGIEKWSKILMPAIFVILFILVLRGLTLEGGLAGVSFILKPDFSQITGSAVLAALGQAFFSLSLGMGTMITYGSYLEKKENMPSSAATVIGLDTGIAVLAGFAIFPALFAVGLEPEQGPGLVFMVLPAVFDTLPLGIFFGTIFFILLAIAALTSAISILEVVVAFIKDQYNVARSFTAIVVGFIIFLVGVTASLSMGPWDHILLPFPGAEAGLSLFDFYDQFSAKILLPVGGMLICLFAVWVWKTQNAFKEITNNGQLDFVWLPAFKIMAGVVAPMVILIVLLNGFGIFG
jgi:NSS family neurotransmitter:Na+ symporter